MGFNWNNFKLKLQLTGRLGHFNVAFAFALLVLCILFYLLITCPIPNIQLWGVVVCGGVIVSLIGLGFLYHYRRQPRVSNRPPLLQYDNGQRRVKAENLPDTFYEHDHVQAMLRGLVVGYDENLVPHGEVIGNVSEQNYRPYSPEEREKWKKKHIEMISGKKRCILKELSTPTDQPDGKENEENEGKK